MPTESHLPRLLIVDDEPAIRRFLKTALDDGEFSLYQAENGRAALAAAVAVKPDVILLDLGLPDMDGVEVIEQDTAMVAGADHRPLGPRPRDRQGQSPRQPGPTTTSPNRSGWANCWPGSRATLRRSLPQSPEPVYRIDELEVDLARRRVALRGEEISLTPTEYDLLRLLVTNAGKVLTHRQILKQIWGATYLEQPHILRVNISNLRHKLEKDASRPRYILTETGVGYRFAGP